MQPKSLRLLADIRHSAAFVLDACTGKSVADYDADEVAHRDVPTLLREVAALLEE